MKQAARSLILYAALSTAAGACAQGSGKLRLMVEPAKGSSYVLDHSFRLQQPEVELTPGPHHFSFWAPMRRVVDTTLVVEPGRATDVLLQLPVSEEYRSYLAEVDRRRRAKWLQCVLPGAVTVGLGIYGYHRYTKYRDAHDALEADEAFYRSSSSPLALSHLKDETIPAHKETFKAERTKFIVSAGLFGAAALGTAYGILRHAKRPKPVFEDKEKLKFDGLVWMPTRGGGVFGLQLAWR